MDRFPHDFTFQLSDDESYLSKIELPGKLKCGEELKYCATVQKKPRKLYDGSKKGTVPTMRINTV